MMGNMNAVTGSHSCVECGDGLAGLPYASLVGAGGKQETLCKGCLADLEMLYGDDLGRHVLVKIVPGPPDPRWDNPKAFVRYIRDVVRLEREEVALWRRCAGDDAPKGLLDKHRKLVESILKLHAAFLRLGEQRV